jgi:CheY-like chemotaxis protein
MSVATRMKTGVATTGSDASKLSILVVDDSSHMRSILRTILVGLGFRRVQEAADGADALERVKTLLPDMILLDWDMPVLSGPETVSFIRRNEDPRIAQVGIIMLASHADRDRVEKAKALGVDSLLIKPVSAGVIRDRIRAVLHFRQAAAIRV